MNKIKIIALFGKSGAGKNTIQKIMLEQNNNYHKIISCTTRPPRDYEKDGVDYYFINEKEFADKVINGSMLEATVFRNWFYGTPIESLNPDKTNIGVFNINGIETLLDDSRLDVHPIYVQASDKTRLLRSLNREENPNCAEICRRYATDEEDFRDIAFDYKIFNNDTNCLDLIQKKIDDKIL